MPLRLRATPQKYRSKAKVVDGIRFHSTKEANRYLDLKLLEKAGEINRILCQPSFDMIVIPMGVSATLKRSAAKLRGTDILEATPPIKIGRYVADFSYWTKDDERVIEDVKGFDTPLSKWKRRHTEAQYGISIRII